MSIAELAPRNVCDIAPYQGGKPIEELAREVGLNPDEIVKLASNENPLGLSPQAQAAIEEAILDVSLYPDGNAFSLRQALSQHYGVRPEQLVFGNGSNDVLELIARAFLTQEDEVIYSQHAFAVYPLVTQAIGAKGVLVPAVEYGHDLDGFLKAITPRTKLIFIANPNNPTGTLLDKIEVLAFLKAVPANVIVVLDEAYDEYLPEAQKSESIAWLEQFENLIVSRTFSKAYGLAGLRVGYGIASAEVIDLLNRVRQPFNVNNIAQAAAIASLRDADFVAKSYALNQAGKVQISQGLSELGLDYIPSFGNFVSFQVANSMAVNQQLLARGVIVRPVSNYDLPDFLRVSVGLFDQNVKFLTALSAIINP